MYFSTRLATKSKYFIKDGREIEFRIFLEYHYNHTFVLILANLKTIMKIYWPKTQILHWNKK